MSADAARIDPFHPLLRVIDRYRQDVHELRAPTAPDQLDDADRRLRTPVPESLRAFLERWNGANLFRGVLRIRSALELAPASAVADSVIVFADGPRAAEGVGATTGGEPEDHWAYAPDDQGGTVFGRWNDGVFTPLHERFDRWLHATVRILDENIREPHGRLQARLDVDPDCGYLLLAEAEARLAAGDPEQARALLRRATAADPGLVAAWARLGETLLGDDKQGARWAFLKALRAVRLPQAVPTAFTVEPGIMRTLGRLFPEGDEAWSTELQRFLDENVRDCVDARELALVEAAAVELARCRLVHGRREEARAGLEATLERALAFAVRGTPAGGPMVEVVLRLASLEADLGHHDAAERRLRVLRGAPAAVRARGELVLGDIAVMRQEPWAEQILAGLEHQLAAPEDKAEVFLLRAERALRREQVDACREALAQAEGLAEQLCDAALFGRVWLVRGDLRLREGAHADAEECWRKARAAAEGDRALLLRVLLRRGDLFMLTGDPERAADDYRRAAEGFADLGLPLREAWAHVRLAHLGYEGAADRARVLFQAADHAAGVAAADAVAGDPGLSIDWHLNRASDHARDRSSAQRARPPLVRADADRPERRLGAHRLAIGAADLPVVHALAQELDTRIRELDRSDGRPTDPSLLRYVAAADLLAGHRSFEASEVLLRHLTRLRPMGLARNALVGAMARSPNAALVHGLLEALDVDGDPAAVAAAAEVLGWRRESEATGRLRELAGEEAHPTVRKAAVVALGRIGDEEAAPSLHPALAVPELAAAAAMALLLLGDWAGVDHVGQALAFAAREGGPIELRGGPGLSRSMGELVGRYGGPSWLLLLMRMAEADGPAALGALQGLGYLGDPRAVPVLIDGCAGRDGQRSRVSGAALQVLTGHHEDLEESLLRNRWLSWWEAHAGDFQEGRRYRHGALFTPGVLIERMAHDDLLVRRTTYDELVISTGVRRPFDADGPWRVQQRHLARWRQWWHDDQAEWTPGEWTFHGGSV
ncbi:MAG: HEAT repeat domain-containing protein [Alphaproteobacteria bacterium]|nr:HEAT repeat domain-containing protein [Alphaproteobacteria bacterium]